VRIQLELPEEDVTEIKGLMREAHIDTYKELFSNALTLLHWAVEQVRQGRTIASMDESQEKYKELAMPILQKAKAKSTAKQRETAVSR
jgi:hypothetical protein